MNCKVPTLLLVSSLILLSSFAEGLSDEKTLVILSDSSPRTTTLNILPIAIRAPEPDDEEEPIQVVSLVREDKQ
ncbi:Hypothetical protein FKW44_015569, partial [Caligus rogercresseyi]